MKNLFAANKFEDVLSEITYDHLTRKENFDFVLEVYLEYLCKNEYKDIPVGAKAETLNKLLPEIAVLGGQMMSLLMRVIEGFLNEKGILEGVINDIS